MLESLTISLEGNREQNVNTLALLSRWSPGRLSAPINCLLGVFSPFRGHQSPLGSAKGLYIRGPRRFVHQSSIWGLCKLLRCSKAVNVLQGAHHLALLSTFPVNPQQPQQVGTAIPASILFMDLRTPLPREKAKCTSRKSGHRAKHLGPHFTCTVTLLGRHNHWPLISIQGTGATEHVPREFPCGSAG